MRRRGRFLAYALSAILVGLLCISGVLFAGFTEACGNPCATYVSGPSLSQGLYIFGILFFLLAIMLGLTYLVTDSRVP